MRVFTHAPGTMMIHLAMGGLPDWAAGAQLQRFAYVHLAPSLDQMARTYAQALAGLLPDEPVLVVGQPTGQDPSRAPEGKHVLWLQGRLWRRIGQGRQSLLPNGRWIFWSGMRRGCGQGS
jgi:phytoene dehydrogenase-like protein